MPREKSTWRPPRGERTNAEHRDGPTRTSEEGRSCGRSKGVGPSGCRQRPTGNRRRPWRQRSRRLLGGSGVSREAPAPFCERPEVQLLRPTRHRALAEATISRYKRVIGDGLRSRTDERRATEMDVGVAVLNRMLELGRPKYVRIA